MVEALGRPPALSRDEYARRVDELRALFERRGLEGAVTFASTMRPGPLVYLTGYAPTNGFAALCLGASSTALLTDQPWDIDGACAELWLDGDSIDAPVELGRAVAEHMAGAGRIGVIGWEILPAAIADRLRRHAELVDIGAEAAELRAVKSEAEIALLREACAITSEGARALATHARAGTSERELAAAIEAAMRTAGSGPLAFPLILGAGAEQTASAVPLPGDRILADGDMVLLDCGATYRGYCGDMARTLVVGEPTAPQRKLLDTTYAIFEQCAAALAPGARTADIHAIATGVARVAGFDLGFLLGHGIGCQNWEPPLLDDADSTELAPGMVVTLEPGIYVRGLGGARLEDTFVITPSGSEALTSGPINLWEA